MTSNYTVLAVTMIVWVGLFIYLWRLDRKTRKLEGRK